MSANAPTTDLLRRLAALSPQGGALFERRLIRTASGGTAPALEEIPVQPRGERCDFPLSSAQERMWFNHQWSPDQPLYNESFGLTIRGDLEVDVLRESFDFVMARDEIFTVTFHATDGRLFQRVGGCALPRLELCDLRRLDPSRREAVYEAESQRLLREPFRLGQGPLFRAGLWTMSDSKHLLIFVMHHIIFDGWSVQSSCASFPRPTLRRLLVVIRNSMPFVPNMSISRSGSSCTSSSSQPISTASSITGKGNCKTRRHSNCRSITRSPARAHTPPAARCSIVRRNPRRP